MKNKRIKDFVCGHFVKKDDEEKEEDEDKNLHLAVNYKTLRLNMAMKCNNNISGAYFLSSSTVWRRRPLTRTSSCSLFSLFLSFSLAKLLLQEKC